MLQARKQGLWREMLDASGSQFDSERQPIQAGTDGRHRRRIGVGHCEIRLDGLRSLDEEDDRLVLGKGIQVGQVFEWGHGERGHGELILGTQVQTLPAGHQYFEVGTGI